MTGARASSIVAVLDSNILYSAPLRDFFLWQAANDLFAARWTADIHDEWMENVLVDRPDLSRERLERTRELMDRHVDGVPVVGYQELVEDLDLPDPDDRHVLAAAIQSDAAYIVTENLDDFPEEALAPHGVEAVSADDFGLLLLQRFPGPVVGAAREHWKSLRNPEKDREEFLVALAKCGLPNTSRRLSGRL